jgi:hypothetical protein
MSSTALLNRIDPLHAFIAGAFVAHTTRPLPLVATAFEVVIDAGVAVVATTRSFRNAEDASIEATITFPVPVHATLFDLTARVGDRLLVAQARRRSVARAEYEDATDAGKTAVLHEEVLRGVHMLSVAHVPPGVEVEVRSTWALTLSNVNGQGYLRIPLTVGDIYGRSRLADSDDLVHGGRADIAELKVDCRDGAVTLRGGDLREGRTKVPLDAPIDLAVGAWPTRTLIGRAADGRTVSLRVEAAPGADRALDVAILVDHSSSMREQCGDGTRDTKHDAVLLGLRTIADRITGADTIDLWEFDTALDHLGSIGRSTERSGERTSDLLALIGRLTRPRGGTEIGMALTGVMAQSYARDLLLITDGKSHALDVQALARLGRRTCVVLVGEDSLEANVGHLSALTGGEIFVAAGHDLTPVLIDALRSLRVAYTPPEPISGVAHHTSARRGGMQIEASWSDGALAGPPTTIQARAVAAVATSLLFPALSTEDAATLAEAEGLVTHLTSLVLVDQAGDIQQTLPATRKVPLPTPRTHLRCMARIQMPALAAGSAIMSFTLARTKVDVGRDFDLSRVAGVIDWDLAPEKLKSGDLSPLMAADERAIRQAATIKDVIAVAQKLGLDPVVLVIGLLAHVARSHRTAARLARAIFSGEPPPEISEIVTMLRLNQSPASQQ